MGLIKWLCMFAAKQGNKILIKDRFLRTNVIFTTAESHQEIIDLIRNACKSSVKIIKK